MKGEGQMGTEEGGVVGMRGWEPGSLGRWVVMAWEGNRRRYGRCWVSCTITEGNRQTWRGEISK